MVKDYYAILGITFPSSPEEIAKAYRIMSKKWHPDLHPGDADAAKRMVDINEAAGILRDPAKKARYDLEYLKAFSGFSAGSSGKYENPNYEYEDKTLKKDVNKARRSAEKSVRDLLREIGKSCGEAARGAWSFAKPILIILLVLLVAVPFCVGIVEGVKSNGANRLPGWKSYDSQNFSICYPGDWRVLENPDTIDDVYIGREDGKLGFTVLHFDTDLSLDEVVREVRNNSEAAGMAIIRAEYVLVSGIRCYAQTIGFRYGRLEVKQVGYTLMKGNTVYNVKFGSDVEAVDGNEALIKSIVASLEVK